MPSKGLVTLLSDFGQQDVYVGVMKGVIAQVNPALVVVDLAHQIPPQNIAAASFSLLSAYAHFPQGTVHIAVVDPGVGSQRRAIAIQTAAGFLVGPDNGIFTGVLSQSPAIAAVEATNSQYWYTPQPSSTFHGRDIFAAIGAHLASGVALEKLGSAIAPEDLIQLPTPTWQQTDSGISGTIQEIDHFGNLITTIPGTCVTGKSWFVEICGLSVPGGQTYSDSLPGKLIGLVGSHGWIEIAVNAGNAKAYLQQNQGDPVRVVVCSNMPLD